MPIPTGALGNQIRKKRIELRLTQEELAEILGITATHMKHLESEHRMPSVELLFRLMETLNFSLDELVFSKTAKNSEAYRESQHLLELCSERELFIVRDILQTLLKHRE